MGLRNRWKGCHEGSFSHGGLVPGGFLRELGGHSPDCADSSGVDPCEQALWKSEQDYFFGS